MSGAIDAVIDTGLGAITEFAADVGSVVTDFGTEFMSAIPSLEAFQIPSFDVSSLGGFGQIGSLAGNASWFDTFNPGSILSSIPSVSDFNISSLTSSLPSLSSIKDAASTVTNIAKTAQQGLAAVNKVATTVDKAASAFGIQSPLTPITQAVQQLSGVAGAAAGIAGTASSGVTSLSSIKDKATSFFDSDPNAPASASLFDTAKAKVTSLFATDPTAATARDVATGLPINTPREVDANGLNILNAQETAQLTKNINPAFVNSLVDPGAAREVVNPRTGEITTQAQPVNLSNQASQYTSTYNPETGQWDVFDNLTSTTVRSGLSEQAAILASQDLNITSGIALNTSTTADEDPFEAARQAAIRESENARSPTEADVLAAINRQTAALTNQARAQQSIRELRNNKAQASDWRVRLRLAPNSTYLYKASPREVGILSPLALTDGVIFPYTPSIDTAYKANYDAYDLTHSNYRGYFYKGSHVDAVNVRAQFTAQDTKEADYLLAVIHFFRSCTKMFYGQDAQRGSPPPLVYLNGYGDYQFNEHPCVVSQFNYTLPPDVDYIRAQNALSNNTNQLNNRLRNPIANNPLAYSVNRMLNSKLIQGALDFRPTIPGTGNLANGSPTYVPTKMEISITLLPIQSRAQVSNNFSVKEFANGNLLRGGYW